jgi:uncharacterized protein (DUF2236 family)
VGLPNPIDLALAPTRAIVARPIRRALGDAPDMGGAAGDPGLFGPSSVTWRVHGDGPSMLVGGVSALLLQTLHPGAMAGVAQHSAFRQDPMGRLRRTAAFVTTTTFGSTPAAEDAIALVRRLHGHVRGTRHDGRPYAADDPDLLRWVHVAEVGQFVRSYHAYSGRPLRTAEIDRYYDEVAEVARRLGTTEVPTSADGIREYYRGVRPELVATDDARAAVRFVLRGPLRDPIGGTAYRVIVEAAIAVLPYWARDLLDLRRPAVRAATARAAALVGAAGLRLALGPSPVVDAARRRALAS